VTNYHEVPETERPADVSKPGRPTQAATRAVLDGKTIFVPLNDDDYMVEQHRWRQRLQVYKWRLGFRAIHVRRATRNGVDGMYIWVDFQ